VPAAQKKLATKQLAAWTAGARGRDGAAVGEDEKLRGGAARDLSAATQLKRCSMQISF
jgi:hypothetical protein